MENQRNVMIAIATIAIVLLGSTAYVLQNNKTITSVVVDTADVSEVETVKEDVVTPAEVNTTETKVVEKKEEKVNPSFMFTVPAGLNFVYKPEYPSYPMLYSKNVQHGEFGGELISGFTIRIDTLRFFDDSWSWRQWAGRPGGSIGATTYEDDVIGEHTVEKSIAVGLGMADAYSKSHTSITYAFPNEKEDAMAEINLFAHTDEVEQYIPIVEEIIKSFKWVE